MVRERKNNDQLSKVYKANPSIEKYLELRASYPDNQIEVALFGGIEHAFKNQEEIEKLGIAVEDYLGILDADQNCISKVCLHLLASLAKRKNLKAAGQTQLGRRGKTIPDQMIDWLICCMLESESWNGTLELNRDLIVLIRHRLMPGKSTFEQLLSVKTQRSNAAHIGGQLIAMGRVASFRKIGEIMGVEPSTVKRWFKSKEEFDQECAPYSRWYDEKGNMLPLIKK
ncbi:MAG: hypothetical protein AB1342_15700 [Pseudomonadota bacterium]